MNEQGAIILEALIRLDYEKRARCNDTDNFHKVMLYTGSDLTEYGICGHCHSAIRLVRLHNFHSWITFMYLIQEWP